MIYGKLYQYLFKACRCSEILLKHEEGFELSELERKYLEKMVPELEKGYSPLKEELTK